MGMFNSIHADIRCSVTGEVSRDSEIQIKWQEQRARLLDRYHVGDVLPDVEPGFDNTWIRTEFICEACSPKTKAGEHGEYIRTEDQRWHIVFVEIRDAEVVRILPEAEFEALGVSDYVDDVWPPAPR